MKTNLLLSLATIMSLVVCGSVHAATIPVTADRDLGLYTQEGAPVAAPGVLGTQRGKGGRMDVFGNSAAGGNGTSLLSFDLAGLVPSGEVIVSATLDLQSARDGSNWDADVAIYPMAVSWTEGLGTSNSTDGDIGFPWGDAAVGDSVYSFQSTTSVVQGEAGFASVMVASAGTAWNTPGAQGIGTDLLNRKMFAGTEAGSSGAAGDLLASMALNAEGIAVLNEWADGSLVNNGLNVFFEAENAPSGWRIATSEFGEFAPTLTIVTAVVPEPSTTVLLAIGLLSFCRRVRNGSRLA